MKNQLPESVLSEPINDHRIILRTYRIILDDKKYNFICSGLNITEETFIKERNILSGILGDEII